MEVEEEEEVSSIFVWRISFKHYWSTNAFCMLTPDVDKVFTCFIWKACLQKFRSNRQIYIRQCRFGDKILSTTRRRHRFHLRYLISIRLWSHQYSSV